MSTSRTLRSALYFLSSGERAAYVDATTCLDGGLRFPPVRLSSLMDTAATVTRATRLRCPPDQDRCRSSDRHHR